MESSGIIAPLRRPKCVENSQNNEKEIDPNTVEFSHLINHMHPKFITDYLQRILNFLLDDTIELRFPNIEPFKRAFLERLTDQNNLKCSRFDEDSKAVANRILVVLRSNTEKFKLKYSYENCSANRGVLIYKKQYLTDKNKIESKQPSSITPNSTQSDNKTTNTNNSIPTNFKIQWLNTTLKFIKDDTQMTLDYPQMTSEMAEFIDSMINQPKLGSDSYGYKSMYAPLWEAMKIFSLKYDFKVHFKSTPNFGTKALMLQKIPKAGVKLHPASNNNETPLIKRPQACVKLQKLSSLISSIRPIYITDSLNQLLNFIINESMASLILCSTAPEEETFLIRLLTLAKQEDSHWIFKNPSDRNALRCIFMGLREAKAKGFWYMTQTLKVVHKQPRKTETHFKKIPRFHDGNTIAQLSSDLKITVNNNKEEPKNSKTIKNRDLSVDSRTRFIEKSEINTSTAKSPTKPKEKPAMTARSKSLDRKSKNPMNFQSAGQYDTVDQSINQVIDQPVAAIDYLPKNKKKIFEAMATPIDIDKGTRMMKLMGWSGGALGPRGEGIIEPIIPTIQIKTGAGLGHIPEPKPPKQKKEKKIETHVNVKQAEQLPKKLSKAERCHFRVTFLKHLLEHIKGDSAESKIEFAAMSLAETNFMKAALTCFNNRKKVGLNTKDEVKYLEQIESELQDSQYVINAEVDSRSRSAILKKSIQPIIIPTPKNKPNKIKPTPEKPDPITILANTFETRLNLLEHVSTFLQSSDLETEFTFNKPKDKQRLDLIVNVANKKMPMDYSTRHELVLYHDILENMKDCCLSVKPVDILRRKYVLQKLYRVKIINSALSQPKNVNRSNDINNNDSDSDDCIIIENDEELNVKTPNNYKDQSNNRPDQTNNYSDQFNNYPDQFNNYYDQINKDNKVKKILDVEYEKKMFQNDIDNIEKGDTVDKCIESVEKQTNCDETSSLDTEIRDLENVLRNCNLDLTNTKKEDIHIKEGDVHIKERDIHIKERDIHIKEGDINIKEEDINIKEDKDTPTSKRSRSDSQSSDITLSINKKNKNIPYEEIICIVPKNYPIDKITIDTAKQIQIIISNKINDTVFLPLIKCFGLKNGTLVYGLYNLQSKLWLENLIENTDLDLKIITCDNIYENDKYYVLDIKINTLIKQDVCNFLLNLEIFNIGLFTNEWKVLNEIFKDDSMLITVQVDNPSYEFIREHEFELYAGYDKALFRLHW